MTKRFVSPVTQMISNAIGIAVRMEAGIPTELHPELIPVALTRGVSEEGEAPAPVAEEGPALADVVAAIDALIEKGDPKAFTADGEPKLAAIRAIAGKAVTDAQRDAAWEVVKARPQE